VVRAILVISVFLVHLVSSGRWPWEDGPAADKTRDGRDLFPANPFFSHHSSLGLDLARKKTNNYKYL
jgi:hypothetical protein